MPGSYQRAILSLLAGVSALYGCSPTSGTREHSIGASRAPIVGGDLEPGLAAVGQLIYHDHSSRLGCTGTLVSPRVFLTGAHCLSEATSFEHVEFGDNTSSSTPYDVQSALWHPSWAGDGTNLDGFDIGMVLLSSDVLDVAPAPMAAAEVMTGDTIQLVGWGRTSEGDATSAGTKRSIELIVTRVDDNVFEYGESGATTCFGDSGGPTMMDVDGMPTVVGVMSYSFAPVCDGTAGATRLDNHLGSFVQPFIDENDPPTPPSVSFISPTDGASIPPGSTIQISASDDTRIDQVQLDVAGASLTDTSAPYTFDLEDLTAGPLRLMARAQDNRGDTAEASIDVTVTAPVEDAGAADGGTAADGGMAANGGESEVDGGAPDAEISGRDAGGGESSTRRDAGAPRPPVEDMDGGGGCSAAGPLGPRPPLNPLAPALLALLALLALSPCGGRKRVRRKLARGWLARGWIVLGLASTVGDTAHADDLDLKLLADESERIAHTRIEHLESFWGTVNDQYGIFTRVRAQVVEAWKGPVSDELEFFLIGGVVGDRATVATHQPSFRVGEEVVVFAFRGGNVLFPTGEAGKWVVRRKPGSDPTVFAHIGAGFTPGVRVTEMPLARLRDEVGQLAGSP